MHANRSTFRVKKMAEVLSVSESGYYSWAKRLARGPGQKARERDDLLTKIFEIFIENKGVYGNRKITHALQRKHKLAVNHKRVENILRDVGLKSKVPKNIELQQIPSITFLYRPIY